MGGIATEPRFAAVTLFVIAALGASSAGAEEVAEAVEDPGDRFTYRAEVDTVSRLFRRESYPTVGGAIVAGGMGAPLYHYATLRVDDLDVPWGRDSVDVELSAWGNLELGEPSEVGRIDGDVHVAKVRQRFDFGYFTLGRQVQAGGAARFVRFDGASAGVRAPLGLGLDAYGGFTVLPRWAAREGYHLLGSAADTLLRDPEALPDPTREDNWLVGTRAYYERPGHYEIGASFHEQRDDGGLGRRNASLDALYNPLDELSLSGRAIVDLDATDLADLRVVIDAYPTDFLSISTIYQRLAPALLLSRQSVLSVFSTEAFDEWGSEALLRPVRWVRFGAEAYLERFEGGDLGYRTGGHMRVSSDGPVPATGRMGYRRVRETINGYHQIRASLSLRPEPRLLLTADGFLYLYDAPIAGISSSIVGVVSAGWKVTEYLDTILATSLARSPYANVDAQGTARLSIALDGGRR